MKTLDGLVGANGKPGKIEILLKGGEKALQEFSKDEALDANTVKCYVLTAPGDIISVDITAGPHTADVFDLEVDGILRASLSNNRLPKSFHGTISKVCFKAKLGKKGGDGAKYCSMKVSHRDASMDATFDRSGTPSSVSCLTIKAWRKDPAPDTAKEATTVQFFSWEEYGSWKELKHSIVEVPKRPFEIDFVDSTKLSKKLRDKMDEIPKRDYGKYSLITTFIFELQSTSNLTALGFEHVPVYVPTLPAPKPPRVKKEAKTQKSQAEVDNEEEDDNTSTIGGLDESKKDGIIASDSEDEGRWVLKSKASKSQSVEPKPKPKTPKTTISSLATFGPPPTTEDILKIIMPYKPTTTPSKKEVSKSLSFSRANLFPAGPVKGARNSLIESIEETASKRSFDLATAPIEESKARANDKCYSTSTKGLVLHGEVGAPARRAALARGEPQEIDSQDESESQVDIVKAVTQTTKPFVTSFTAINHKKTGSEAIHPKRPASLQESPEFEPLTPPASNKKALPRRSDFEAAYNFLDSPSQSFSLTGPTELYKSITLSRATTASTQDVSTQARTTAQDLESQVNLDKVVQHLEATPRKSAIQRATSPTLSEATEVADPMEIMESVRNSQRDIPGNNDFQREITDYYHNIPVEKSGQDLAPLNTVEDASFSDIKSGNLRDQVRESWEQQKSLTPSNLTSFRHLEKRKAEAIGGGEKLEGGQAHKMQKTAGLEQKMMTAKAKFAAATERNLKLERERRAALEVKKQKDEVEALLRKAEEMEQTNDELEAEISALNESNLI